MNYIQRRLRQLDKFQQAHASAAFPYAVIKKYGDDQAGFQAALLTYYGFLALFPLLLVLTTVAGIIGYHNQEFGERLVSSVSNYFPVIGQQLDSSVHGLTQSGLALLIGLLFTLYGARGIANAFRNATNHVWHVPQARRSAFPRSLLRNISLIVVGGGGFLFTALVVGWAAGSGHGFEPRVLSVALSCALLSVIFVMLLKLSLPMHIGWSQLWVGALVSAVGLTLLQAIGGYFITHQAKSLSSYSTIFATTLGLLAWIYVQAQVVLYAIEIDTVRGSRLWPRSLAGNHLTAADKQVYTGEATKEQVVPKETVHAEFRD